MSNILVLNMGLKSVRSIIFNSEGKKLASSSISLETTLKGEHVTQNPDEWWKKSISVINASINEANCEIDYITVTTSSACLVYVDNSGEVLDSAIMVSDKRAKKESEDLSNANEFRAVKDATELGSDAYLMLPKILWVKNNQPELYNKVYKFLSPNDYLVYKLTGKYITDYFNAQKYHYDCESKKYPIDLLNELGIDNKLLPEVVSPGSLVGFVAEKTTEIINVSGKVKIVLSTYDAICSFFGSGPFEEGTATDISGTVTTFRTFSKKNDIAKNPKIFKQTCYEENINIVGGSNNLGGGLIEWVKQCYYINEKYPYEVMEKEAKETELGANGLIFLPYLLGERAPIWNNNARGVFFGLERTHTRKHMTKAVFESAGFVIKDMIHEIEKTGIEVTKIKSSGGLARINYINQLKADITGKDIYILDDFETTAIGAAILSLVAIDEITSLKVAADKFVSVRMIIKPNMENHEKYCKLHKLYKKTYYTLESLFDERRDLIDEIYVERNSIIENL